MACTSVTSAVALTRPAIAVRGSTLAVTHPASGASRPPANVNRAARLTPSTSFFLLASITVSFMAGSSAPTPLYPFYQAEWSFSSTGVTVVFGIYALALLGALLVTGRLSDHLGRRPVLLVATFAQAATMLIFATAGGLASLLVARVIQGLATGAALAAVGAGMLDLDKARGALANAAAPPLGTAFGAITAGLMVHFLPAPAQLVYVVLAAIFVAQGIGIAFMAESVTPQPGAVASLKPRFCVPTAVREPLLIAIPVLIAAWSLAGLYASLGPALMRRVFGLDASLLGGVALFVLAASGALAAVLVQRYEPRRMMALGASALLVGVAVATGALSHHAVAWFFLGTAVAGIGFGAAFQGAVRTIVPFAAPHERAGVLSVIFVVSYLAMGIPAVIAGYLITQKGNLIGTAQAFGIAVMVLAALAIAGMAIQRTAPPTTQRAG